MKNLFYSLVLLGLVFSNSLQAEERLRLATTTSTDNTGLLAELHPIFEKQMAVKIDVIAVGTGKALKLGENGDVDVVMVHAPAAEKKFIGQGFGIERKAVMHNDFVIVGPASDPASLKLSSSSADAMLSISKSTAGFISRGDDSGTHKKEKLLWSNAAIEPAGAWYLSVGQGMGAVLQIAHDKLAYALSDRGTYLAYKNKIDLDIVYEGEAELLNPYHVIIVNPERHPHTKLSLAEKYVAFLQGKVGQEAIRNFTIDGEQLFYPDIIK
ncbi:MAG: tungsten ABC transporter substrate-binding protein [Gammaproteobacteria bacterium]|nr:tungsten ABC transporter substrate-binding protein [Gammaproteobacteria bacterium]